MRAAVAAALLLAAVSTASAGPAASAPAAAAEPVPPAAVSAVSVELEPTTISIRIGQRFSFTSTVRNDGDQPLTGLIAHLNVLSIDPGVYVDPEDWSPRRTVYIDAMPANSSTRVEWSGQAVNSGRFVVYVAVTARQGPDGVTASNALRLTAAQQRTLDAGGILPLAAAVPGTVLVLTGIVALRRRRLRQRS
jgi:hypothetical protein